MADLKPAMEKAIHRAILETPEKFSPEAVKAARAIQDECWGVSFHTMTQRCINLKYEWETALTKINTEENK